MLARKDLEALYKKVKILINKHEKERRKRFEPFFWLIGKEMGKEIEDEKFRFSLAVATYVLENSFHLAEKDKKFYEFLKQIVKKYGREDFQKWIKKSPLPFSEYIEASYDFRD